MARTSRTFDTGGCQFYSTRKVEPSDWTSMATSKKQNEKHSCTAIAGSYLSTLLKNASVSCSKHTEKRRQTKKRSSQWKISFRLDQEAIRTPLFEPIRRCLLYDLTILSRCISDGDCKSLTSSRLRLNTADVVAHERLKPIIKRSLSNDVIFITRVRCTTHQSRTQSCQRLGIFFLSNLAIPRSGRSQ